MEESKTAPRQESKSPPKKPLTPFFMFKEAEKQKGNSLSCQQAGVIWHKMSEEERAVFAAAYRTERDKFVTYLETDCGMPPRGSPAMKKLKQPEYRGAAIRAVCGTRKNQKEMSAEQYKAMGAVVVKRTASPCRRSSCWI